MTVSMEMVRMATEIPTKKEQMRTPGFTSRLPCHIIKIHYLLGVVHAVAVVIA